MRRIVLFVLALFMITACSSTTSNNQSNETDNVFEGECYVDAVMIDNHIYWTYAKNYSLNTWDSSAPCSDYNHIEILGTINDLCESKVFPTENLTANFEEAKGAQYGKVHDQYVIELDNAWYYLYDEDYYLIVNDLKEDTSEDDGQVENLFSVQLEGTRYYVYGDVSKTNVDSIEISGTIKDHCDMDEYPSEDETCNRWLAGVKYGKLNDQYVIEDLTGWHYLTTEMK